MNPGRGENDSYKDCGTESDFPSETYEGSSTVTMVGTVSKKSKTPKCSPDHVSSSSSTLKVSPIVSNGFVLEIGRASCRERV